MAFELAVIKLAYQWLRVWQVRTDTDRATSSSTARSNGTSRRLKAA
jgi:hypothetical protein